jgi:dihydrofolate reductase
MKKIILIAARSRNGVIGNKGKIPWNIPYDLERFKRLTRDCPIIMGKKTWESLPLKPLPRRINVVVTSDENLVMPVGHHKTSSLSEALEKFENHNTIFLIGGEKIYTEGMSLATDIYLTEVDIECEGDVFFPEIDTRKWWLYRKVPNMRREFPEPSSSFAAYRKVKG